MLGLITWYFKYRREKMADGNRLISTGTLMMGVLYLVHYGMGAEVNYSILEQSPTGTLVGNIPESIELANLVSQANLPSMRYSFLNVDSQSNNLFALDARTGILRVSDRVLDRELVCPYTADCVLELQIAIQSMQTQFFRKVTINVDVLDINDNAPQFKVNQTTLTISESVQVPSTFPLPSAQDKDTGLNNSLREYELVPQLSPFELVYSLPSSNLFLRVVKELDREVVGKYSMKIIARDGGAPPKEGTLSLEVVVEDVNDNQPVFTKENYSKIVDETVTPGTVLVTLTATDSDSGNNGQVRYSLSRRQPASVLSMFAIGDRSGELRLAGDFQTAETEVYKIDVEASDQGVPPFTSTTTVTITVQDTINSPPKLVISYLSSNDYSSVSEYANLGVAVAHILVKDTDRGPNGIVQCNLTTMGGHFELQSYDVKEYKVIVAKPLDRETISTHNVTVECYDAGTPTLSTSKTFQVKVTDENDNAPEFKERLVHIRVKENNMAGLQIAKLTAVDIDDQDSGNGRVTYRLSDSGDGDFVIDPSSGVIKAMTSFDYEKRRALNFTVVAEDNGVPRRSAKCDVVVNIVDENDNSPQFAQSRFVISVSEYADGGTVIGDITASDMDSGDNGHFEISLVPGSGRSKNAASGNANNVVSDSYEGVDDSDLPFLIRANGSLVLMEKVDHEVTRSFEFEVEVRDSGGPQLSNTATVVVDVRDENDNGPQILHPNVSEIVFTALTGGDSPQTLMTFEVVDRDSGENGRIVFTVTARNDSGRFDVDQKSGDVVRTRGFTANDAGTYKLSVMIKDSGNPPLYDVRTLLIHVLGGNGTAPGQGGAQDQYIVIALTLVCVTVLLSVTILLVIVIMRRLDRRRKASRHMETGSAMQFHNSRVVTAFVDPIKLDHFRHEEDSDYGDKDNESRGDNNKKTISDSQFGFSTSGGNFNKTNDVISSQVSQENNLNLPTSPLSDFDLLQTYHNSKGCPAVPEDGASDSSGETITSDSGRGGSDEDISASNNLSGNSLDDSRGGHNGSFQSNLSTFCHNPSIKSSVKDPVRSSSRKHVTFKDMERFRNSIKCQPATAENTAAPNVLEGGAQQGTPYTNGRAPSQAPVREMNIPVSREKCSTGRPAPPGGYNSYSGNPVSKNNPRSLTSPVFNENLGRDSPRLVTFSNPQQQQTTFQNVCNPRLPMYCTEDNIPSPMPTEAQRDWKVYPVTGSQKFDSYMQMASPIDKHFHQQHVGPSQYTVQNSSDPRAAHSKESNWAELLNNINSPKEKLFQRAPSNASLSHDQRLHSPAPYVPPRRRQDDQSPRRDVHASLASLTGKDVSKFQTSELPRTSSRDWINDSLATTEDGDDQRSTTTSGSYTIDTEEDYLALEYKPKDIVV